VSVRQVAAIVESKLRAPTVTGILVSISDSYASIRNCAQDRENQSLVRASGEQTKFCHKSAILMLTGNPLLRQVV
jgi:lipopolysaccharide export system protein LptA